MTDPARRLWQVIEPYHAVTYFHPACREAFEAAGVRGFWRGYFAGRAAPMGAVDADTVTACFYGFAPAFVARAIPSVWELVTPADAVAARLAGVDVALRALLGGSVGDGALAAAASILRTVIEEAPAGDIDRPLFAANRALAWPSPPHLGLWHAATVLREHRGDGHVAALRDAGIGPCESHVLRLAADGAPIETVRPHRGWSTDEWAAAVAGLWARDLLTRHGSLTGTGAELRRQVEATTDRHATEILDGFPAAARPDVETLFGALARTIAASGVLPFPNPMGLPRPRG